MSELKLGELLRQHRWQADLTQKDLAKLVGGTQPWISRVERGKVQPTSDETRRLAAALSLDARQTAEVIKLAGEPRPTMTADERRAVVKRIETLLEMVSEELARLR
jgi:predicted transcriptional regulator